jgi:hypothetical protein
MGLMDEVGCALSMRRINMIACEKCGWKMSEKGHREGDLSLDVRTLFKESLRDFSEHAN